MKQLSLEEVAKIFTDFLNEQGEWFIFKDFIENKGYKLEELGIEEE